MIERGLMFRQNLPPDDGMLFLLGVEKDWPFWMRNTLIPLDMIYIAKDMKVVGVVANAEPETDTIRIGRRDLALRARGQRRLVRVTRRLGRL